MFSHTEFLFVVLIPMVLIGTVLIGLDIHDEKKFAEKKAKSDQWIGKYNQIKTQIHPNEQILSELYNGLTEARDLPDINQGMLDAVHKKAVMQNKTLSPLEQTMTIGQLYNAGNLSWVQTMTLEQLEKIYYIEHFAKKELVREKIQEVFDGK